jgi:hypothetical protein
MTLKYGLLSLEVVLLRSTSFESPSNIGGYFWVWDEELLEVEERYNIFMEAMTEKKTCELNTTQRGKG